MISGLAGVSGLRSQSPYRSATASPASARNAGQGGNVQEPQGGSADLRLWPVPALEGLGERHPVRDRIDLGLLPHPYDTAVRAGEVAHPVGRPGLPGAGRRVPRLEDEPPVGREGGPDGAQRQAQLLVADEDLEGVPGHHDEIELAAPLHGPQISERPLDTGFPPACLDEHRGGGVDSREPPGVSLAAGPAQQLPGTAPDIEHGAGRHHQVQTEVVPGAPRIETVVQRGQGQVRERAIHHRGSLAHPVERDGGTRGILDGFSTMEVSDVVAPRRTVGRGPGAVRTHRGDGCWSASATRRTRTGRRGAAGGWRRRTS
jgi:hypothetical protein